MKQFDLIVIGAGAAGLMCAQIASSRGLKVLILEHSLKLAEKIRISGGGRCNFTNINTAPECYISHNPHYIHSALSRFTPYHFTEILDNHNIAYHEKTLGQLFCNDSSNTIIQLLDFLCSKYQVERIMGCSILQIERINSIFHLSTKLINSDSSLARKHGSDTSSTGISANFSAENLVIACGGLSIPQIGATGFGYSIARQFKHKIIETHPALVPLTLSSHDLTNFRELAGISCASISNYESAQFREMSLFTHRGLSGPAILQISSYWKSGTMLSLNLLPDLLIEQQIQQKKSSNLKLSNFLSEYFAKRLALSICNLLGFDLPLAQLSNKQIIQLSTLIHNFSLTPSGTEGYKKAEVTRGGVDTQDLSSKTMMSNKVAGLYFIGEVTDVTGWLGGYNFQWAWASASACATSI